MRIALVADIHGNSVALDAVIADMARQGVDGVVCLGDIAVGGPDPTGVIERVDDLGWAAVRGNTDVSRHDMPGWWRDPATIGLPDAALPGMEISVWGVERLSPGHENWLADLRQTEVVDLGDAGQLLAFHGSPRSVDEMITDTTPDTELEAMFEGEAAQVLAGGHTHVPLLRLLGGRQVLNPGSVGMPFAGYGYAGGVQVLDHAAYAIVNVLGERAVVEFHQVDVDRAALEASVRASGMPHGEWWLGLSRPN